jgi:hypothetical protein
MINTNLIVAIKSAPPRVALARAGVIDGTTVLV